MELIHAFECMDMYIALENQGKIYTEYDYGKQFDVTDKKPVIKAMCNQTPYRLRCR